eukprot:Clim_evm7s48 gene=Clim_evmTU7s48
MNKAPGKIPSDRTNQVYDSKGRRVVAGAVIYNDNGEILLISSSKEAKVWILPKGGWENTETVEEAAVREAEEEAGVTGTVEGYLGRYILKEGRTVLDCFVIRADLSKNVAWTEEEHRLRVWVNLDEALRLCNRKAFQAALERYGEGQPWEECMVTNEQIKAIQSAS